MYYNTYFDSNIFSNSANCLSASDISLSSSPPLPSPSSSPSARSLSPFPFPTQATDDAMTPASAASTDDDSMMWPSPNGINDHDDGIHSYAETEGKNDDDSSRDKKVTKTKPNIFLVTLDDIGYNDAGWQSNDIPGSTPYMNAMAEHGITLTNYYGQATCTPARSTIMSGRFTSRTRSQDKEITVYSDFSLHVNMTLLPAALKRGGYRSYGVGKWNIGHCNIKYMPWNRGFEAFFTQTMAGMDYYDHTHDLYDFNGTETLLYDLLDGVADDSFGTFHPAREYKGTYSTNAYSQKALEYLKDHHQSHHEGEGPGEE